MALTRSRRKPSIRALLLQIDRKVDQLMQELLNALAGLKADREAFITALQAEFTKLEGEITNPASLAAAKQLVEDEDTAIKAVVIPTV
jgi:cell division protein ZapA (FtsZ GTPase activity inhibitor)